MRLAALFILCATAAAAADPGPVDVGTATLNGEPVVLMSDGVWHYASGERCVAVSKGELCADAADWYPVPRTVGARGPAFRHDGHLAGVVEVWAVRKGVLGDIEAHVLNSTMTYGLRAGVISRSNETLANRAVQTVVYQVASRVDAITIYPLDPERLLVFWTTRDNSTLFSSDHAEAHRSFVGAYRPGS